ncbi:MAG: tRNA lysidine(34) synthetase TilS [Gammaproteobacteria bacterium]
MVATTNKELSSARLLQALSHFPAASRYWIAYSGGLDSHVMLHAMATLRSALPGVKIHAVHVDHGLQSCSAEWSRHCETVCAAMQIPCNSLTINAHPKSGESPEAAARDARYQAIAALIEEGDCLLTAHHQDDQAETLLLQLLRGAGPHGLASMPECTVFGNGLHARPLLGFTQSDLRAYAQAHDLHWIDDQSNRNTDFNRNYLRHEIMPRLRARWPAVVRTLSRSASHAAEAAHLLDDLAQADLRWVRGITDDPSAACALTISRPKPAHDTLFIPRLCELNAVRQRNVLRAWFHQLNLPLPNAVHIAHILNDVLIAAEDSMPCLRWPGAELRRYREHIYAMRPLLAHDPAVILPWDMQGALPLPADLGTLITTLAQGQGLKASLRGASNITVRFRQGGEHCRPADRGHTHELRKLFQEAGIPPWQRQRMPLIYVGDDLAAVGDLWVCEPFQAVGKESGIMILEI